MEGIALPPWKLQEDLFFDPSHVDERVSNQDAVLCVQAKPEIAYDSKTLIRFTFTSNEHTIDQCERQLWEIGMRHARILPGLDGLCRDVNQFIIRGPGRVQSNNKWRPIPSTIGANIKEGLSIGELEQQMISGRNLLLNLKFHGIRELIGIGVEISKISSGHFHAWLSAENKIEILDTKSGQIISYDCDDTALRKARIWKEHINQIYPDGKLIVRRRIT